jgi:protein gp37
MGAETEIAWTDHTFNPWWGCQRVSPGCEHCYAETFSKRVGLKVWGPTTERRRFGEKHWSEPLKWDKAAERAGTRARVFCASMADVFEDRRDLDDERKRLFELIDETPSLDWQLLTKRPENMRRLAPIDWSGGWPENVWAGTTVEDQRRADERVPWLLEVPAVVRFLSCEPLLEHTHLCDYAWDVEQIDWVIVGGESGPGARPCNVDWIRSLVNQCLDAKTAVFVKQLGARPMSSSRDDKRHVGDMNLPSPFRLILQDRKGADMGEWPEGLRVRQFPTVKP